MVAKDIRWIRLLDPENHNISWANHISQTNPGKRDKSDPSFKRQWSRLFHCAALVAFTGGKDFGDVTAIWHSLDSIKLKYDDMVLLHGGGPGAEKIAASWAEKNGVHQVVCKPNSITSRDDRSALEMSEVR